MKNKSASQIIIFCERNCKVVRRSGTSAKTATCGIVVAALSALSKATSDEIRCDSRFDEIRRDPMFEIQCTHCVANQCTARGDRKIATREDRDIGRAKSRRYSKVEVRYERRSKRDEIR